MTITRAKNWGYWLALIVYFVVLMFPPICYSAENRLVVNEVYANPEDDQVEFVELFNLGSEDLALDGFAIIDESNQPYILNGYEIEGNGYLLLQKGTDFSFAINNDKETLTLKSGELVIDSVVFGYNDISTSAPVPPRGKSLNRFPDGKDTDDSSVDFRLAFPTPGEPYEEKDYSKSIFITEVFPSPEDGVENEFVEIFNGDSVEVDLDNWQLDDSVAGSPYVIHGVILQPGQYLHFPNSQTKITLNDSGDSVILFDPNSEVVDSVTYESAPRNQSYSKIGNDWVWTDIVTPGRENEKRVEVEKQAVSIADAKELDDNSEITTQGIVTVLPGVLSSQYFYIQDESSGIQVYSYGKNFPPLNLGERLEIKGTISTYAKEKRIKISKEGDINKLNFAGSPEPKKTVIDDIDEEMVGMFVEVNGEIIKKSTASFFINEEGGPELKILLREGSGLTASAFKKGNDVQVFGILSRYNDSFRVLPTSQMDVRIISQGNELPRVGLDNMFLGHSIILAYLIILSWNIYRKMRKKLTKLQVKLQEIQNRAIYMHYLGT